MPQPIFGTHLEADYTKYMDPAKLLSSFKLPLFNMDALIAAQRRNLETCTAVNQAALEGWQSLIKQHSEMLRQNLEQASSLFNSIMSSPTAEEKVLRHAEASKLAVEKCIANAKGIADTVTKTNSRAMETVTARLSESVEELRGMMATTGKQIVAA